MAGVVVGARAPVVIASRADPHQGKLYSLALGVVLAGSMPALGGLEQRYLTSTNLALLYAALGGCAVALALGVILARGSGELVAT